MQQKEQMSIDDKTKMDIDSILKIEQTNKEMDDTHDDSTVLSNRKKKEMNRPSIAALKKVVNRSDLVEEHDCNAFDPYLLLQLKSMRNTIAVPDHWSQKRKYLQGKRGFLKPPFHLPSYISSTGITDMRDNRLQTLDDKSLKQKQRERMRPRKGGLEINYQTLHQAFFKHQTKPQNMSTFGQLYYEGKDQTLKYQHFRPGYISDRLKNALGMVPRYRVVRPSGALVQQRIENTDDDGSGIIGAVQWKDLHTLKYGEYVIWDKNMGSEIFTAGPGRNKRIHICSPVSGWVWIRTRDGKEDILKRCDVEDPPPWLINIQRFGISPAYPDLKVSGLNAPIPPNRSYGFHEGQWGKPPVDENGHPMYGDPFGVWTEPISNSWAKFTHWGTLQKFDESTDDEQDSDDDEEDDEDVDIHISGTNNNNVNKTQKKMDVDVSDVSLNGNLIKNNNLLHVHASRLKNITLVNNESGTQSISSGIASDQSHISVRKKQPLLMDGLESPLSSMSTQDLQLRKPELYHVLQPKYNAIHGRFGSSTVYDMSTNVNDNVTTNTTENNDSKEKN